MLFSSRYVDSLLCVCLKPSFSISFHEPGFIIADWCGDEACEVSLKEIGGLKSRCILEEEQPTHKCAMCGKDAKHRVVWGIQY